MSQIAVKVGTSTFKKSSVPYYYTHTSQYNLLYDIMGDDLLRLSKDPNKSANTAKLKNIKKYISKFNTLNSLILSSYDDVTKELYLLHETAKSLQDFNDNTLKLSDRDFRAKLLYPNIIYILIRLSPNARSFLQKIIGKVYNEINKKSSIIKAHINSLYLDENLIKSDVLYSFLGNGLKKLDPLQVNNLFGFYTQVFRNIFHYYFKADQGMKAKMYNICDMQDMMSSSLYSAPMRLSIYRDILYNHQVERMYKKSPTISQIYYNFSIFQNIVISNEFQNMYFSTNTDISVLNNDEYKLIKFYSDDLTRKEFIESLKKLPLIYQLLRCIHISYPGVKAYNELNIKPDLVQNAVLEELMYPFKNFFHENVIYDILTTISENFTLNILSGEYINPLTLSTTKIEHVSFIIQLKKFIGLCLTGVLK
ncbi:MAG: hypothetical protein ACOC33_00860 [bacterium]